MKAIVRSVVLAAAVMAPGLASAFSVTTTNDYASALALIDSGTTLSLPSSASWVGAGPDVLAAPPTLIGGVARSPFEKAYDDLPGTVYTDIGGDPYTGTESYYSVGNGTAYGGTDNPAILDIGGYTAEISLLWGSPDPYNKLELVKDGTVVFTMFGDDYGLSVQRLEASHANIAGDILQGENFNEVRFYSIGSNAFEFAGILTGRITNFDPVPLPAGVWLMGTALAGLGLARRKRKAA